MCTAIACHKTLLEMLTFSFRVKTQKNNKLLKNSSNKVLFQSDYLYLEGFYEDMGATILLPKKNVQRKTSL